VIQMLVMEAKHTSFLQEEMEKAQRGRTTAQKETESAEEERDELQRVLNNLETVIQFRLETVFKYHEPSYNYDVGGVPRTQPKETPEEEKVLGKLLSMVTHTEVKNRLGSHF